jgi:hypothetical protein
MPTRPCPRCRHTAAPVAGRCPVPSGTTTLCGCVCGQTAPNMVGLSALEFDLRSSVPLNAVLRAVGDGHTYAETIARASDIPEAEVVEVLSRFERDGWMVSELEVGWGWRMGRRRRRYYQLAGPAYEALGWAGLAASAGVEQRVWRPTGW